MEFQLARVFQREIDFQRVNADYRRELSLRYDWSSAAGFDAMDFRAPRGRITRYEIADFVRDHYAALSEADLDAIIRRCDTDEDESLSFSEFEDAAGVV